MRPGAICFWHNLGYFMASQEGLFFEVINYLFLVLVLLFTRPTQVV